MAVLALRAEVFQGTHTQFVTRKFSSLTTYSELASIFYIPHLCSPRQIAKNRTEREVSSTFHYPIFRQQKDTYLSVLC